MLGYLHDETRDNAQAIWEFERAIAEQERAVAAFPGAEDYQNQLCVELDNLGEQYVHLGRVEEGLPHYRRAIGIRESLAAAHPEDDRIAFELADKLAMLGTILRHGGDSATAHRSFVEAHAVLDRFADPRRWIRRAKVVLAWSSRERPSRWPTRAGDRRRYPFSGGPLRS